MLDMRTAIIITLGIILLLIGCEKQDDDTDDISDADIDKLEAKIDALQLELDILKEKKDITDDKKQEIPCCYYPLSADAGAEAPYDSRNNAEAQRYFWQKCTTFETKTSCTTFADPKYPGYACLWKDAADWCAGLR